MDFHNVGFASDWASWSDLSVVWDFRGVLTVWCLIVLRWSCTADGTIKQNFASNIKPLNCHGSKFVIFNFRLSVEGHSVCWCCILLNLVCSVVIVLWCMLNKMESGGKNVIFEPVTPCIANIVFSFLDFVACLFILFSSTSFESCAGLSQMTSVCWTTCHPDWKSEHFSFHFD